MSNVRPPSAREEECSAKATLNRSNGAIARVQCLAKSKAGTGSRQPWLCKRARQVPSGGLPERAQLSPSTGGQSKFERGGRLSAYVREIQGRSACATAGIVKHEGPLEGTTHARPAQQMQL